MGLTVRAEVDADTGVGNCSELKGSAFFAKLGTDLQRRNQSDPANQSLEEPEIPC